MAIIIFQPRPLKKTGRKMPCGRPAGALPGARTAGPFALARSDQLLERRAVEADYKLYILVN